MNETVQVKVPNKHTKLEARRRIEEGFSKIADQIGGKAQVEQTWNGDTLSFRVGAMGQTVDGSLTVFDDCVDIVVSLPWLLAKLAGPITQKLESETQLLLK